MQPHASHITSDTSHSYAAVRSPHFHFQIYFPLVRGHNHGATKLSCRYRKFSAETKIGFDPFFFLIQSNIDQCQGTTPIVQG